MHTPEKRPQTMQGLFLPTTVVDLERQDIDQLDVILISGDAYVDHPSFGTAMVGRFIQSLGMTVGIIAMPSIKRPEDFTRLGAPRYFFGVTAGNVDSMVSLFTAQKKIRNDDPYVPENTMEKRPQRASIAYCNALRFAFKNVPIVLGGVEASLRRIAHYDYWSDTVRQSILLDAKADLLIYGMGEKPLEALITGLKQGKSIAEMKNIPGTAVRLGKRDLETIDLGKEKIIHLPSFEEVLKTKQKFSDMTRTFYENMTTPMLQQSGTCGVLVNPPAAPLTQKEIDRCYELPFTYLPHPAYKRKIPAYEQIKDSFTIHRGCFGGCNFCGLGIHQGKTIQSRSKESIIREIRCRSRSDEWKGIVSDLGGPTANMYELHCTRREASMKECKRRSCLCPTPCEHLYKDQSGFADLITRVDAMKEVEHVYVNSGIRMDLALLSPQIIEVLAQKAVGGQMSIAPEHTVPRVLKLMNKPEKTGWDEFEELFNRASEKAGKKQFLVPYLMAGHPGSSLESDAELGNYLKKRGLRVRQVQEFMPIPMTVAAAMYYTGQDPFTGLPIAISYKLGDKRQQKELIMWWLTESGKPRDQAHIEGTGQRKVHSQDFRGKKPERKEVDKTKPFWNNGTKHVRKNTGSARRSKRP